MFRKAILTVWHFGTVAFLVFAVLLAGNLWGKPEDFVGDVIGEFIRIFRDPSTQWVVVLSLAGYVITFLILEQRVAAAGQCWRLDNANIWLAGLTALMLLSYASEILYAAHSPQVVFFLALAFGKGMAIWVRWQDWQAERRADWMACLLIFLFAATAWVPSRGPTGFQYHGAIRWNGIWDNPNLCGMLTGMTVVLAAGMGLREWRLPNTKVRKAIGALCCLLAVVLAGYGLFWTYSRGAWLGTAVGLLYLAAQVGKSSQYGGWLRRNRLPLTMLAASLLALGFWQFRFTEMRPAERAFSAANANDFSWRNRVAAWEGSVHMMADRPLLGFGRGKAESVYATKYCQANEPGAIELNDYLMLGISSGVPALVCFAVWLGLTYGRRSAGFHPAAAVFTVCRSGSIVLLVGFWFDGGLFKWPVAPVFWMLAELARLEPQISLPTAAVPAAAGLPSNRERWLRRAAWILGTAAGLQTLVYVGTPYLPVSEGTVALARKCLVPPKAANDFAVLSAEPIWRGQRLKTLLEHVELANYNRTLVNWTVDEAMYRDFVLNPVITGGPGERLDWRRVLWEEFYPRIRHETSPVDAAVIVARHLRERVTVTVTGDGNAKPEMSPDIAAMWRAQVADAAGWELIYVAALRSVGVPARLGANGQAELFADGKWQAAPQPVIYEAF